MSWVAIGVVRDRLRGLIFAVCGEIFRAVGSLHVPTYVA